MTRSAGLIGALGLAAALGGCNSAGYPVCRAVCTAPYPPAYPAVYAPLPAHPTPWDDPFADYTQRILTVSPTAGNAQAANVVLQTATPWPRYSQQHHHPRQRGADGEGDPELPERDIAPPLPALESGAGGGGAGGAAGGAGATGGGAGGAPGGGT